MGIFIGRYYTRFIVRIFSRTFHDLCGFAHIGPWCPGRCKSVFDPIDYGFSNHYLVSNLFRTSGEYELFPYGNCAAGSIFLFYRAWKSFRTGDVYIATCSKAPNSLRTGVLVNLLNPNPYLFWFTVGSPMLLKGYGQSTACAASFLGAFYVCLLGAKCGIALMVGRSRHLFKGKAYLYTMRLLGVFLLVFAAMLFHSALCYL